MGVQRLIQGMAGGSREERRRSPRVRCRLHCSLKRGRRWLRGRVLDVSEHGLCLLSPVELAVREPLVVRIDVPDHGPVEVEATAWHVRRVKAGNGRKKAWSVGLMISRAGEGFERLLPAAGAGCDPEPQPRAEALDGLQELRKAPAGRQPPPEVSLEPEPLGLPGAAEGDLDLEIHADDDSVSAAEDPAGRSLHLFRVRVKAVGGPRTRSLTLGAASADEAQALARSELEGDWAVLDVRRA